MLPVICSAKVASPSWVAVVRGEEAVAQCLGDACERAVHRQQEGYVRQWLFRQLPEFLQRFRQVSGGWVVWVLLDPCVNRPLLLANRAGPLDGSRKR